jgi:hypothetical protein
MIKGNLKFIINKRAESFVWIVIWVFILGIIILGIW